MGGSSSDGDGASSAENAAGAGKGGGKHAVLAQMLKAAGQRQHWKEAIVLFDRMQSEVCIDLRCFISWVLGMTVIMSAIGWC